ncbi:hypothetical protein RND81_03G207600 [Saponaria officinalis]|uniref:Glycosyl transferase CAP10 domain-containing protein n=1 Tax=Saponaria officinalis TaxID=3572 RepID=A0AAW1M1V6_SAPOF
MEVSTSPPSSDKNKSGNLFDSSSSSSSSSSSLLSISSKFSVATASFMLLLLFLFTLLSTRWSDISTLATNYSAQFTFSMFSKNTTNYPHRDSYLLNCTASNMTLTCPANYPPPTTLSNSNDTCPEYFRWIHEDLKTWKEHGITRDMVESLKEDAHFRVIIVNGTAYVKQYHKAFQTRDVYTLWGILQLLNLYPGRLPDLDLMFQCHDQASIKRDNYKGDAAASAPPQFHYCADDSTFDIVFPDWSFWGWPEINIKPWVPLVKDLEDGNTMKNWTSREEFAFWKGNLHTGARKRLSECNSIENWGAQIIQQNWAKEAREGFRNSDLSKQCVHRYKIYMEGNAWSVSEKYILACDSMTLLVNPIYYDFFTRTLIPMKHYWPVNPNNLCKSIKFAVNWGNNNTDKAEEIGRAGSEYIFNQIKIEHVYDYMFHVLNEYAKLLRYKPTVVEGAEELCSERFACSPMGLESKYKAETIVSEPSERGPCTLPTPYDPDTLRDLRDRNVKIMEVVDMWERGSS